MSVRETTNNIRTLGVSGDRMRRDNAYREHLSRITIVLDEEVGEDI